MSRKTVVGIVVALLVMLIAGCAKQGYPSGGPRKAATSVDVSLP